MIKMIIAHTNELDNSEKAVRDILDQINPEKGLLKNSAALLFCNLQFIEAGIMETICSSLPFDVLGCTCQYSALQAEAGEILLTVAVLTSDDTEFAAGVSEPLDEKNAEDCICSVYHQTCAALGEKPVLAFAFQPIMFNLTPDVMTAALDRVCEGLPIFGSLALDMDTRMRHPMTIYRGKAYSDRVVLLLFKGPVKPRFYSFPFPGKPVFTSNAVITKAVENRIISINNKPAVSFLTELGLLRNDGSSQNPSSAIPLVMEGCKGTEPKVVIMRATDPDGSLVCSSHVHNGEIMNIGAINAEDVLESARTMARKIQKEGNGANLLMFSCILRSVALGGDFMAEIDVIRAELNNFPGPWLFLSSGGEICPQSEKSGKTVNRVYQYALIVCQL